MEWVYDLRKKRGHVFIQSGASEVPTTGTHRYWATENTQWTHRKQLYRRAHGGIPDRTAYDMTPVVMKTSLKNAFNEKDARSSRAILEEKSRGSYTKIKALEDEKGKLEKPFREKEAKFAASMNQKVESERSSQERTVRLKALINKKAKPERSPQEKDVRLEALMNEKFESERLFQKKSGRLEALTNRKPTWRDLLVQKIRGLRL